MIRYHSGPQQSSSPKQIIFDFYATNKSNEALFCGHVEHIIQETPGKKSARFMRLIIGSG